MKFFLIFRRLKIKLLTYERNRNIVAKLIANDFRFNLRFDVCNFNFR